MNFRIIKKIHDIRARINAWGLNRADDVMHRLYGDRKRAMYRDLPATIVEIGPGAGANLRYYASHTHLIAIEPNPAMHKHLRIKAKRYQIDLTIKSIKGDAIDLPDDSMSAVVGTLVLCTVEKPGQVLSEIRRILKPGGRYFYLEHVADIPGTRLRRLQERLFHLWHWLFEGCHLNRSTQQAIMMAGFSEIEMDCFTMKRGWLPFAPHIFGSAIK